MYLKAFFVHDLMNRDPAKRKKIRGLIVEIGRDCQRSCWCENGGKCKYRSSYKFHNTVVKFERWVNSKLSNKRFHIPIYFQRHTSDLSGTKTCPHQMPRAKTCWNCSYQCGDRNCDCKERSKLLSEGKYEETQCEDHLRCKFWKPLPWFHKYDRKTGESTI